MSEKLFTQEAQQRVLHLVRDPLNIYVYGSRAYGCNKDDADFDFIVITDKLTLKDTIDHQNLNATVYSLADFKKQVEQHEISALECLFLPDNKVLKQSVNIDFTLDIKQLRKSLSAKSSNSWVKAKKKFDIEHEDYIAKKSLFHSLRILMFGIQLAETGRIVDFAVANKYWNEIISNPAKDWKTYKKIYKPIFNQLKTQFRKAAPK